MTGVESILEASRTVLVVDWPSRDVPAALARAGIRVIVRGGPGPADYTAYERDDSATTGIVTRPLGAPPAQVDLVYAHRPVAELPGLVAMASALGASAIWLQSGLISPGVKDPRGCWAPPDESRAAREMVERAGMTYVDSPYIGDAVRRSPPMG